MSYRLSPFTHLLCFKYSNSTVENWISKRSSQKYKTLLRFDYTGIFKTRKMCVLWCRQYGFDRRYCWREKLNTIIAVYQKAHIEGKTIELPLQIKETNSISLMAHHIVYRNVLFWHTWILTVMVIPWGMNSTLTKMG